MLQSFQDISEKPEATDTYFPWYGGAIVYKKHIHTVYLPYMGQIWHVADNQIEFYVRGWIVQIHYLLYLFILFIWGFTSLSTLYRSYHDG